MDNNSVNTDKKITGRSPVYVGRNYLNNDRTKLRLGEQDVNGQVF